MGLWYGPLPSSKGPKAWAHVWEVKYNGAVMVCEDSELETIQGDHRIYFREEAGIMPFQDSLRQQSSTRFSKQEMLSFSSKKGVFWNDDVMFILAASRSKLITVSVDERGLSGAKLVLESLPDLASAELVGRGWM